MTNPTSAPGSGVGQLSDRARRDRALAIRTWAAGQGIHLDHIGRIPKRVVELWERRQREAGS